MAKTKKEQKSKEPRLLSRAFIDSSGFNEADNSFPVVFSTENPVRQRDYDGDLFYEVLSHDPAHVRLERLTAGGPILDNHDKDGSVRDVQLGVVENPQIINREGRARLRFSKRASVADVVNDIKDGTLKNVSARYIVYQYRDITKPGDKYPTLLAIDWEPIEVSMVPVPADYKSRVRSADFKVTPELETPETNKPAPETEQIINIETTNTETMPTEEVEQQRALDEAKVANAALTKKAADAERKRSLEITEAVRSAKMPIDFAKEHIEAGTGIDQVRALIIEKWAAEQDGQNTELEGRQRSIATGDDNEAKGNLLGFEEAIQVRAFGVEGLGKDGPKTEYGKRAANGRRITLLEHGIRALSLKGIKTDNLTENEIFSRSMTTGDFPLALANTMNNTLRQRYEQAEPVWKKFAKKVNAKDFKPLFSVQVDGDTKPGKLTEKGEYPYVVFKEAGDSFKLDTYGLKTSMTRQMFINDNLGAFENFAPFFADGMLDNQTELVYAALLGANGLGRTIGEDNKTVFHADHGNYDAAGAIMSLDSFRDAVTAMRRQKTLAKRRMKGNKPKYLVVPPELETLAYQLINATTTPNTVNQANPFKGMFEVLVEDYFENETAWLLISDPSRVESVKYATLDGQEGIFTEQWWDPNNDCWTVKARNDFSATVEEFRGVYQNAGDEA